VPIGVFEQTVDTLYGEYEPVVLAVRDDHPKNITLKEIYIGNLFNINSKMNVSILTDADVQQRFSRILTNVEIEEDGTYDVSANLQCWEFLIIKVETSEGFHTKHFSCQDRDDGVEVTETFVTRMSSLLGSVEYVTEYDQLAEEISQPIAEEYVIYKEDKVSYLKAHDVNEALSTGFSKPSVDEEILFHLKRSTDLYKFNLIDVKFVYVRKHPVECNMLKYWTYLILGYPYYLYF
jgi:hypothetical protein